MRIRQLLVGRHTGGAALPRGIGCGATRAEGAVSAQNQPILYKMRRRRVTGEGKEKKAEEVADAEIVGA